MAWMIHDLNRPPAVRFETVQDMFCPAFRVVFLFCREI